MNEVLYVMDLDANSRKGYRSRLEIVRDMLQIVDNAGNSGSKKTHVMYGANLSYKLLTRYLDDVLDAGLIHNTGPCYLITERGKEFLKVYEDYEREHVEVKKHNAILNSGKEELEKMLKLMRE
jgi:predicted transcriptional regulator